MHTIPEVDSSCRLLIVPLFRGSSRFESLFYHTIPGLTLHVSVIKRKLMMMMMVRPRRTGNARPSTPAKNRLTIPFLEPECRVPPQSATSRRKGKTLFGGSRPSEMGRTLLKGKEAEAQVRKGMWQRIQFFSWGTDGKTALYWARNLQSGR